MADESQCRECGHWWPASDPPTSGSCPVCGARLSGILREAPSAVACGPNEQGASSGVLDTSESPPTAADDAASDRGADEENVSSGDSDSSIRTTVFDFPFQPTEEKSPELSSNVLFESLPSLSGPGDSAPAIGAAAALAGSCAPAARTATSGKQPMPLLCKLAISYSSTVTLVCVYLGWLLMQRNPTLDLPDLAPPSKGENRVTTLLYVPAESMVHPAQQLMLGETRQYGALRVTPLRVTRGPLEFDLSGPAEGELRPPTKPVLKLHLQFENVSTSQEVIPLDRQLVFTKEPDRRHFGQFKANNFLCAAVDRSEPKRHVLVYDLSPASEWMIRGENIDQPLPPGKSIVSFIPTTEEGWDALSGELVWRVHLRKGYNPGSLRGVTTLIEVNFNSSEIVDDSDAPGGGI